MEVTVAAVTATVMMTMAMTTRAEVRTTGRSPRWQSQHRSAAAMVAATLAAMAILGFVRRPLDPLSLCLA